MSAKLAIPALASGIAVPAALAAPSSHRAIIDFLYGRNDGARLMLALYGDLIDEKLPPRLAALVERWRSATRS